MMPSIAGKEAAGGLFVYARTCAVINGGQEREIHVRANAGWLCMR